MTDTVRTRDELVTLLADNDTGAIDPADIRDLLASVVVRTTDDPEDVQGVIDSLNLGGAATLNVGTSAGTVAAGDDSRITGALQKSSNLSDVANAAAARSNLGLGSMATQSAGGVVITGGSITGMSSPTNPSDVAIKSYVDNLAAGLNVKGACAVATTANISLSGLQTIDGYTTIAGDRVLVKDQSTSSQNGVYAAGVGAWTRATDADVWAELVGALLYVSHGSTQSGSEWVCTIPASGTLGTDAVAWSPFSLGASQPLDATLTSIAALSTGANKLLGFSGVDAAALYTFTSFAASLIDDANAATARTTLGLGDSATKNTGTSTGTVAAGDDSRITGAAQKASNLSDLASASTARSNLGLGNSAVASVGTTAGTVAAGDDARITGAAQKSSNLSDLANASTARTNLGLSTVATMSVGTTTGTVAAGDDSRITGAIQSTPSGTQTIKRTGGKTTLNISADTGQHAALMVIDNAASFVVNIDSQSATPFSVYPSASNGGVRADGNGNLYVGGTLKIGKTDGTFGTTLTFPVSNGSGVFVNDGSGNLSWTQAPALTNPTVTTQSTDDSSTKVASTAYVTARSVEETYGRTLYRQLAGAQPYFLWDPTDRRRLRIVPAASFTGGSEYLTTAGSSDFDFSTVQKFSVFFMRSPDWNQSSSLNGLDSGYIGQWNSNTAASWLIGSGGSTNQGNNLRLVMATNSSGSTYAVATTANDNTAQRPCGTDYDCACVTYDGTNGTAANRAVIYKDGVSQTLSISGTLPANPQSGASINLRMGGGFGSVFSWKFTGKMRLALIFKNRVLNSTEVQTLTTAGKAGKTFQDLVNDGFDMTGIVGAWDLSEPSGTRYDFSTKSHHLTEGSTVASSNLIIGFTTSDRHQFSMFPPAVRNGTTDFVTNVYTPMQFSAAPEYYESSPMNGTPAIRFRGSRCMYAKAFMPYNVGTCEMFMNIYLNALPSVESFVMFSAAEHDQTEYWGMGFTQARTTCGSWLRIRNPNNSPALNGDIDGNLTWALSTPYVSWWRVKGSGNASSFEHWLNGNQDTLTYAETNSYNVGPANVGPRHNVSMNALVRSGPSGGPNITYGDYYLGKCAVLPALSTSVFQAMRDAARTEIGAV